MPTSPQPRRAQLDKKPPVEKKERRALLWDILKKLAVFAKPYRLLIIATLALTALGSFTAQVNAFVLRYAVDTLTEIATLAEPWEAGVRMLTIISAVLLTKEILSIFISFGQRFFGEKIRINLSRDLSQKIIERILTYRMAFYTSSENDSGKLQTRIDYGVSSLTSLVQNFFIDMLPLFANAIVALIIMFSTNFWIGLVGLIIIPIYFFISQKQAKRLQGFRRQMRGYREAKSGLVISLINSISVVKSFVRESIEAEKHLAIQKEMTDNQLRIRSIGFVYDAIKTFIEQIGVVVIILLTAYFVLQGEMTIGMILFHVMLFQNVAAPIRQLHRIYDQINNALTYAEGFFDILEDDSQVESIAGISSDNLKGHIELKHVDFTYPNGTQALKDVSFTIKPNRITALVGLSGAGKSTIINLLVKFYAPDAGTICLDGHDLADCDTHELRQRIGLVLQSNHIFSGTISENIRYGDMNASIDDIIVAAKKASIHDQIMGLADGYESTAKSLSGGQQQRIALARMFLKDPPIVFLDEPTASLDAIASQQVKKSLDLIKKDRTVIMVSHNIAQIIDADDLVVIENGQVVETGTHEALYAQRGKYFEIFSAMSDSLNLDKISQTLKG
ncbi:MULTISPECIES: ABC transporter ATP-binding protein [Psychrobacter]|uniref:ABC transporter ATP-binding protein n=1 Tax=Psychrobacter TaxID=497 RepID=UPI0008684879|nr:MULTISPECIES: ABC transporter ATP-binding protein [Psychrobacter]MBA6244837.1 ABC transporter ATP-binding protein [Psychrobacter sp. Urea-trap-18]MBA6285335.1 ABC transporter ATP-binding protein [Psychrobacter sp. Urea-trap-16]MBA6318097.1 ABC transporter ATP-binding protein [Psychrobacter sp. Urea-trap-20]MBA6333616.1 ABC transporter ATP-binding protein [Psychrobacter sp. Urea-trap-19]OEH68754.1 MAG: ABC transporter [Psychrobacter sp. B29-1]|tara:strand:+ start:4008 stop:5861 length:1854 start_codon:yes stop_codon:yes gene_type:complete